MITKDQQTVAIETPSSSDALYIGCKLVQGMASQKVTSMTTENVWAFIDV
jgi:hypothetical protein